LSRSILGKIKSPTWGPCIEQLKFSVVQGGSDSPLYINNVTRSALRAASTEARLRSQVPGLQI